MAKQDRADYGIDAPGVVRNLLMIGGLCVVVRVTVLLHVWSGNIPLPIPGQDVVLDVTGMTSVTATICIFMAFWMIWDSKIGKLRGREQLLDRIRWSGEEQVLDVGCGRGLMLIGAARRLTSGKAIGIDVWQSEDLSGNEPDAALKNAEHEGVRERISIQTADMRQMPFAAESFDVIVSRAAIHNLYRREERARAIAEIARVLKTGGHVLLDDIRHLEEYTQEFSLAGCKQVTRYGSRLFALLLMLITWGSLRPGSLLVKKGELP